MNLPLLSVILPVYNGEKHIPASLDSVLAQTFTGFELIIIDDGSTDATAQIAADYAKKDQRIRIISNGSNLGIAESLSRGLSAARGMYIARMDADDISLPERLEMQIKFMQKHPNVAVCGCQMRSMNGGRKISYPLKDQDIRAQMVFRNPIGHSAVMFKKDAIVSCGGYDISYVPAEDYDLWTRLALRPDTVFANLADTLVLYRELPEAGRRDYYVRQFLISGKIRAKIFPKADANALRLHEELSSLFAPSVAGMPLRGSILSYLTWLSNAGGHLNRTGFCVLKAWIKFGFSVILRAAARKLFPRKIKRKNVLFCSFSPVVGGSEVYMADLASGVNRDVFEPVHLSVRGRDSWKIKEKTAGIQCYVLSRLRIMFLLPAVLFKERPDVVHLNLNVPFSCFYMMFLLRMFRPGKVVATVHSTIPPRSRWGFFRSVKSLLCRLLFPVVDKFICVSNASKKDFCRNYGISESKVSVVHNGIRPFAADPLKAGGDISCVGCVARLDRDKGIEFLLRAFSSLCPAYPGLKCLIAGEGGDIKRLKRLAASLGISGRVEFAGYVSDKTKLFSSIDIFVLPSLHEAFPLTILEAMHAGRPVVATGVGGVPELVEDRVTGLIVEPMDPDAIEEAVKYLLNNCPQADAMAAAGKKRVEEQFLFDKMLQKTENLYFDLD